MAGDSVDKIIDELPWARRVYSDPPPILPKEAILDLMAGGVVKFSGKYEEKVRRWNG